MSAQGNKSKKDKAAKRRGLGVTVKRVLSGSYLTREYVQDNLPFIFYVVFIMMSYIAYGYYAERNIKELVQAESQLRELKARHTAAEARLEQLKQQSQVAEKMSELGLRESTQPPIALRGKDQKQAD